VTGTGMTAVVAAVEHERGVGSGGSGGLKNLSKWKAYCAVRGERGFSTLVRNVTPTFHKNKILSTSECV
jgi:hypothetical protein